MDSTPKRKRSLNPERRMEHVCRSISPIDRDQPRVVPFSRSTVPVDCSFSTIDRAISVHVVHTSRPDGRPGSVLTCNEFLFLLLLTSDLCAIFLISFKNSSYSFYLLYLLSPYNSPSRRRFFKSEPNSNEHLAKSTYDLSEIDTQSRRNRHTISTWPINETCSFKRIVSTYTIDFH